MIVNLVEEAGKIGGYVLECFVVHQIHCLDLATMLLADCCPANVGVVLMLVIWVKPLGTVSGKLDAACEKYPPTIAKSMVLAFVVEMLPMDGVTTAWVDDVSVAGSEPFASHGVDVVAPETAKQVMLASPFPVRVAVMTEAESAAASVPHHTASIVPSPAANP
jgi:hypothetical protein